MTDRYRSIRRAVRIIFGVWVCALLFCGPLRAEGETAPQPETAPVLVGDNAVFTFSAPLREQSAKQRAAFANRELQTIIKAVEPGPLKQRPEGGGIVIYFGDRPVLTLTQADATATGEESLQVYADGLSVRLAEAVRAERQRAKVATRVFSASLVVFFALIAMFLVRRLGELGEKARRWAEERGDTLALRILQFELLRPEMAQSAAVVSITLATWVARVSVVYTWLAIALSLFEETRGYTGRLANWVISPISDLASRVASTLPVLVVAFIATIATWIVVRFVGVLFTSVARRETQLAWVPPDLAMPTSILLRTAIVIAALVVVFPVVTGDQNSALARSGILALLALGLASVPILASAAVGAVYLFGHRIPVGQYVQVGDLRGRVQQVTFLELRIHSEHEEIRVPSLYLLRSPLIVIGSTPRYRVTLVIDSERPIAELTAQLVEIANRAGSEAAANLTSITGSLKEFQIRARFGPHQVNRLLSYVVEELDAAGVKVVSGRCDAELRQ
jgi:small-conductance mechanosensitive channel